MHLMTLHQAGCSSGAGSLGTEDNGKGTTRGLGALYTDFGTQIIHILFICEVKLQHYKPTDKGHHISSVCNGI